MIPYEEMKQIANSFPEPVEFVKILQTRIGRALTNSELDLLFIGYKLWVCETNLGLEMGRSVLLDSLKGAEND